MRFLEEVTPPLVQVEGVLKKFLLALATEANSLTTFTLSLPLPSTLFHLLPQAVAGLQSLLHLSLQGSQLGDAGAQELCTSLQQGNRSVTHLDLSGCSLTDTSAASVAALLKTGALKYANLSNQRFRQSCTRLNSHVDLCPDSCFAP